MTITKRIYARRTGGMLHWRLGRIGGSLYLSNNDPSKAWADRKIATMRRRHAFFMLRAAIEIVDQRRAL